MILRDPERLRKVLGEIHRIWKKYPDMRFGQLIDNLYTKYYSEVHGLHPRDYFYAEDDEFYDWLVMFGGW